MKKKGELEKQVITVLKTDERSRNDDIRLTQVLWYLFYKSRLIHQNNEYLVRIDDLFTLPREDHISRIRRKIQNDRGEYLPTDPAVRKKRSISTEDWQKYLGYDV